MSISLKKGIRVRRSGEDVCDQASNNHETSQQQEDWILEIIGQVAERPGYSVKHRNKIIIAQQRLQKVILIQSRKTKIT